MTSPQLSNFRTLLEARESELEMLLRDREVIAVNASADILDQIQHRQEREMAIGNLERASARLIEVRSALDRVRLNTYGICLDCEEEIGMKRLAAVPWTRSCLACREVTERNLTQPSDALEESALSAA